jgi:hypothetical protein
MARDKTPRAALKAFADLITAATVAAERMTRLFMSTPLCCWLLPLILSLLNKDITRKKKVKPRKPFRCNGLCLIKNK